MTKAELIEIIQKLDQACTLNDEAIDEEEDDDKASILTDIQEAYNNALNELETLKDQIEG